MIDGKPYHYVYEKKLWVLDKTSTTPSSGAAAANVVTQAAATAPESTTSANVALEQKQQLAVANASRLVGQAMSNLVTQLKEC